MKKYVVLLALLAMPAFAFAGSADSLTLLVGTAGSVDVNPGDTISVSIVLDSTVDVAGWSLKLDASSANVFDVTAETKNGAPWSNVTFPSGSLLGGLDTTSGTSGNLGLIGNAPASAFPATIDTVDILVDLGAAPGAYTITAIEVKVSDANANPIPVAVAPLAINVLPEPATMLLLAGALPFLRRRRMA